MCFSRVAEIAARRLVRAHGAVGASGCAQDLVAQGMGDLQIAQAGRWSDSRMPQRYAKRLPTKQDDIAHLVAGQGRR